MSENLLEDGIFYPDAIKFHKGKKMRVRGTYAKGFPIGAIVHSTDGRPNDGAASTEHAVNENLYAYFVIGRGGKVFQSFSLTKWAEHAGPTLHPALGGSLSTKLVEAGCSTARTCIQLFQNGLEVNYLQTRVGGSM